MKTKTENILKFLKLMSWIIFIGILITIGGSIVSFTISFINPELLNRFGGEFWYDLKKQNNNFYNSAMSFNILFSIIHAYIWYLIIQLFSKINLQNPFNISVSKKLEIIAYLLFTLGTLSIVGDKIFSETIRKYEIKFIFEFDAGYIFIAGIVYIISQIFKRGVELQEENELTV